MKKAISSFSTPPTSRAATSSLTSSALATPCAYSAGCWGDPARYYAWIAQLAGPSKPAKVAPWRMALVHVFARHQRRYGTRRLRAELQAQGYRVGRQRLRTELRCRGLCAVQPCAFTPHTTDSTHGLRCALNRLLDRLAPSGANQVWVSDITYLPLASGQWAYLCAFSGRLHPLGHGLASAGHHARIAGDQRLTPSAVSPSAST